MSEITININVSDGESEDVKVKKVKTVKKKDSTQGGILQLPEARAMRAPGQPNAILDLMGL